MFFKGSFNFAGLGLFVLQFVSLMACKQVTTISPTAQLLQSKAAGAPGMSAGTAPSPSPLPSLAPAFVPRTDVNCMASGNEYDACVFFKNPVYDRRAPFASIVGATSDLSQVQTYGVKILNRDTSGFLQNATFRVVPPNTIPRLVADSAGKFKVPFSNCTAPGVCTADTGRRLSQVMAYYWLDTQEQVMRTRTGRFYASGKNILVNTYQTNFDNAAWDAQNNRVLMGVSGTQDYALSAEVYNHEMGHANLDYATNFVIFNSAINTEVLCAQNQAVCCRTSAGCIDAINEGQADYHAAIVFNEGGTLGETLLNTLEGISECGIGRSISGNRNLNAATAFAACGFGGEIHVTGRVYASIWWEVRSLATSNAVEVDRLFSEHLAALSASDTFSSALSKIRAVDAALFAGKYSNAFIAEFARRGL